MDRLSWLLKLIIIRQWIKFLIKYWSKKTALQVTKKAWKATKKISSTTIFITTKKVAIRIRKIAITKVIRGIGKEKKVVRVHWTDEVTIKIEKIIRVQ